MRTSNKRTKKQSKRRNEVVKSSLSSDEMARFEAFIEAVGATKATYIRKLILCAMDGAEMPHHGLQDLAKREA